MKPYDRVNEILIPFLIEQGFEENNTAPGRKHNERNFYRRWTTCTTCLKFHPKVMGEAVLCCGNFLVPHYERVTIKTSPRRNYTVENAPRPRDLDRIRSDDWEGKKDLKLN